MERHQDDGILRLIIFIQLVDIGHKGKVGQEGHKALILIRLLELLGNRQELVQVLEAALGFNGFLCLQHVVVSRLIEDLFHEFRDGQILLHSCIAFDHFLEFNHGFGDFRAQSDEIGFFKGREHGNIMVLCISGNLIE